MLYDRPYMRPTAFRGDFSFLKAILVTLVAAFVIQSLVVGFLGRDIFRVITKGGLENIELIPEVLRGNFSLTMDALKEGKVWTLATYAFLHADVMHLLFNMLAIFFIGRALEPTIGSRKLCILYFASTVAGGIFWLIVNQGDSIKGISYAPHLLGASAAAMGILAYFCAQRPNENITLLLFFVLPCNLKPKWVLWGILGISTYGLFFSEIYGGRTGGSDGIAHSAHLGGIITGLLYYKMSVSAAFSHSSIPSIRVKRPAWMKVSSSGKKTTASSNYTVNFSNRESIQEEVDRILDKINDEGFGALTEEEKKTLDRAKHILNK